MLCYLQIFQSIWLHNPKPLENPHPHDSTNSTTDLDWRETCASFRAGPWAECQLHSDRCDRCWETQFAIAAEFKANCLHGSLNVPIEHHPTIRYMVYNGYYKVMSNISKMGQLPTPGLALYSTATCCWCGIVIASCCTKAADCISHRSEGGNVAMVRIYPDISRDQDGSSSESQGWTVSFLLSPTILFRSNITKICQTDTRYICIHLPYFINHHMSTEKGQCDGERVALAGAIDLDDAVMDLGWSASQLWCTDTIH